MISYLRYSSRLHVYDNNWQILPFERDGPAKVIIVFTELGRKHASATPHSSRHSMATLILILTLAPNPNCNLLDAVNFSLVDRGVQLFSNFVKFRP